MRCLTEGWDRDPDVTEDARLRRKINPDAE